MDKGSIIVLVIIGISFVLAVRRLLRHGSCEQCAQAKAHDPAGCGCGCGGKAPKEPKRPEAASSFCALCGHCRSAAARKQDAPRKQFGK